MSAVGVAERFTRLPSPGEKVNGLSRSAIYELHQSHKGRGLLKKHDRMTLVDMAVFNKILADMPAAKRQRESA